MEYNIYKNKKISIFFLILDLTYIYEMCERFQQIHHNLFDNDSFPILRLKSVFTILLYISIFVSAVFYFRNSIKAYYMYLVQSIFKFVLGTLSFFSIWALLVRFIPFGMVAIFLLMMSCYVLEIVRIIITVLVIKQSKEIDYKPLKDFIQNEFNVEVQSIKVDVLGRNDKKENRVNVKLKYDSDFQKFCNKKQENGVWRPFDTELNKKITEEINLNHKDILFLPEKRFFVIYSSFENEFVDSLYKKLSKGFLFSLKKELEDIWQIRVEYSTVYIMCNKIYEAQDCKIKYEDKVRDLIYMEFKKHDEYNFVKKDEIRIVFDSKENIDLNYEGSWFYYLK